MSLRRSSGSAIGPLWGWPRLPSAAENKTFCCVHGLRAYFGFPDDSEVMDKHMLHRWRHGVSPSTCHCCHGVRHVRVPRKSSSSWSLEPGGHDQVACSEMAKDVDLSDSDKVSKMPDCYSSDDF